MTGSRSARFVKLWMNFRDTHESSPACARQRGRAGESGRPKHLLDVTWQGIAQPCQLIIATPMPRVRWSWLRLAVNPLPAVRKSEMGIKPGTNRGRSSLNGRSAGSTSWQRNRTIRSRWHPFLPPTEFASTQTRLPSRLSRRNGSPRARDWARSTSNSATQSFASSGSTNIC